MTNIFAQYEQASQRSKNLNSNNVSPEINTLGYIQMKLEQDPPMFNKVRMNFTPSDKITHMAVSNNYLIVAMANNVLFRMDLSQPEKHDEITLTKFTTTTKLTNIFLDPLGQHILLSFIPLKPENAPELVYLSRKSAKLKPTVKFQSHEITQVAWNYFNESEVTTGPILLGTSKGLILETEINQEVDKFFQINLEQYWRQVFDIGKGTNMPITGLEFNKIPNTDKYFVFVTTANRLYYFTGYANQVDKQPLLLPIFNNYLNVIETYHHMPSVLKYSKLKFWYDTEDMVPKSYGWLTESGLFYGELNSISLDCLNSLVSNSTEISFPKSDIIEDKSKSQQSPIAFILTEFHALLCYKDIVKAISVLNNDLVFEDSYNETFGKLINIIKDPTKGSVWAVTERAIFSYKIIKEERNVWQIYCEKQMFDLAKMYSTNNPGHYDQVLVKEANVLFENKLYELSAQCYAETQSSFEEICLKFLQIEKYDALKIFLKKKLNNLKPQDKTQITMIVLWVVELYLSRMADLRLEGKDVSHSYMELQKEFESFLQLPNVLQCIKHNKSTIYDLMASHGDKQNLIKLTIMNDDFEQVIRQHIYKNSFLDALEVLKKQNRKQLFYQFSPILMQEIPKQMVSALIAQGPKLIPVKLLPALVSCEGNLHSNETIRYLEFCTQTLGCNEKAIHNLLLSLYANVKPEKLMEYLASQGQNISMVCYDVHFALRLCREKNLIEACVQLSALLGLWESAVDLSLQVNVDLAKQIANMPQNDNELRKKLWLKIAQHVISGKDDIQEAMEFLHQCDLIRIEDILSFFSDFTTIDHFKNAICTSLQECNQQIQDIKEEMEEATESAERVRKEIQSFRNCYTFIKSTDTCAICSSILMVRGFYLFPCGHKFHSDCLLQNLTPTLGPAKCNKLHDLQRQLKVLNAQVHFDNVSSSSVSLSMRDQIKADIDTIIASECLYCGEIMIRNIDRPFIEDKDYDKVMKEWE